jgi:hypothetical protein
MHVALGLLAAALAGEPSPTPHDTIVSFQFRVLEEVQVCSEKVADETAEDAPVARAVYVPIMPAVVIGPVSPLVIALPDPRSLLLLGRVLEAPGLAHPLLPRWGVGYAPAPPPPSDVAARRSMPTPPARSLPPAFDPDGTPAALPPLPDDELKPASSEESAEPRPSPQTRPSPASPKSGDTSACLGTNPVGGIILGFGACSAVTPRNDSPLSRKPFDHNVVKANLGGRDAGDCCAGSCARAVDTPASGPITIRIQFQGDRAIEIRGSMSWASSTRRTGSVPDDAQYFPPGPEFPWANTQKPSR